MSFTVQRTRIKRVSHGWHRLKKASVNMQVSGDNPGHRLGCNPWVATPHQVHVGVSRECRDYPAGKSVTAVKGQSKRYSEDHIIYTDGSVTRGTQMGHCSLHQRDPHHDWNSGPRCRSLNHENEDRSSYTSHRMADKASNVSHNSAWLAEYALREFKANICIVNGLPNLKFSDLSHVYTVYTAWGK